MCYTKETDISKVFPENVKAIPDFPKIETDHFSKDSKTTYFISEIKYLQTHTLIQVNDDKEKQAFKKVVPS